MPNNTLNLTSQMCHLCYKKQNGSVRVSEPVFAYSDNLKVYLCKKHYNNPIY